MSPNTSVIWRHCCELPGIDFINVLRAHFSYEIRDFGAKKLLKRKGERKMLMKLSPAPKCHVLFE
jgi:hypothetical protein